MIHYELVETDDYNTHPHSDICAVQERINGLARQGYTMRFAVQHVPTVIFVMGRECHTHEDTVRLFQRSAAEVAPVESIWAEKKKKYSVAED